MHRALAQLPPPGRARLAVLHGAAPGGAPAHSWAPIVALCTDRPRALAHFLQAGGFLVRPIVYPTVPRGTERVRVCLHAANTAAEVDGLVARLAVWLSGAQDGGGGGSAAGPAEDGPTANL